MPSFCDWNYAYWIYDKFCIHLVYLYWRCVKIIIFFVSL